MQGRGHAPLHLHSVPSHHPAPLLAKDDPMFPVPPILCNPGSCSCAGEGWCMAPSEPKLTRQLLPPLQTLMAFIASIWL